MVDQTIRIPRLSPKLEVRLLALYRGVNDSGPFTCLQASRQPIYRRTPFEQLPGALEYNAMLFRYTALLADAVGGVDAFASPPSDHPLQAEPYRRAIANKQPNAPDITTRFTRRGEARAASGATFDAIVGGLDYTAYGRERDWRRVAIIDDVFRSGVTAAATVTHMRKRGLRSDCEVIVACPLWLDR
jgi:hypothetical protein